MMDIPTTKYIEVSAPLWIEDADRPIELFVGGEGVYLTRKEAKAFRKELDEAIEATKGDK